MTKRMHHERHLLDCIDPNQEKHNIGKHQGRDRYVLRRTRTNLPGRYMSCSSRVERSPEWRFVCTARKSERRWLPILPMALFRPLSTSKSSNMFPAPFFNGLRRFDFFFWVATAASSSSGSRRRFRGAGDVDDPSV